MELIYGALALELLSAYLISQSVRQRADPKTTAFLLAVVFVILIMMAKPTAIWVFFYIALGLIASIIVSYWVSMNVISFREKRDTVYDVPYWFPLFFAQSFLVLHWVFQYISEHNLLESYD